MNAERSNYALISALYADKSRGLYKDIYFPIIKYAIIILYGEAESSQPYLTSQKVHDKIAELFHINIPTMVIAMTVRKIEEYKNGNIVLETMEKGNAFRIKSADYDEDDAAYEEKQREFDRHIIEIEGAFRRFKENEGAYDDGVNFIDFIADNTETLLEYFDNRQEQNEEDKYTTIVFFLGFLNQENKELFKVANQLFWSSIIAAFLQSERPDVKGDDMRNTEYFLDTSLVLGLLNLATEEREECSREVCDIIKAAGGQLKVHPLTIEEIKAILTSVEMNGPYAYSSIADAYTRFEHTTDSIARIRVGIVKEIEKLGVTVFPQPTTREKAEAIDKYKGREIIRKLNEKRTSGYDTSYSADNFREIHDIYMDDYIRERNKSRSGGHTFFLTSNKELKEFCNDMHPAQDFMKAPGKVILEYWMHSSKPSDISSSLLTETMARCMDLHRAKVRNKISEVSKKFKDTKDGFSKEVYEDFLKKLYSRAKHVITVVEGNPEDMTVEAIKVAVTKDNQHFQAINSRKTQENEQLSQELNSVKDESEVKSRQIGVLTNEKNVMAQKVDSTQKEIDEIRAAKETAERLVKLYARKEELNHDKIIIEEAIEPLENSRYKSISRCSKWMFAFSIMCGLAMIVIKILTKKGILENVSFWWYIGLGIGCLLFLVLTIKFVPDNRGWDVGHDWELKNPAYKLLNNQRDEVRREINRIEEEIQRLSEGETKKSPRQKRG